MNAKFKALALLILKLFLSGALLWVVLSRLQFQLVLDSLRAADPWLLCAWYLTFPIAHALIAIRWRQLAPTLPFSVAHKYTWIGVFWGQILPGSIAGDLAKGVALTVRSRGSHPGLAMSIIAEKLLGLAALVVVFDIACLALQFAPLANAPQVHQLALVALVLTTGLSLAVGLVGALAVRHPLSTGPLAERKFGAIRTSIVRYAREPRVVARVLALSLLVHAAYVLGTWLGFRALQIDAGFTFAAIVYPVLSILLLIPVSISGVGVRDATLVVLFQAYGLQPEAAVALSWAALAASVPNILIGAAIQLWELAQGRAANSVDKSEANAPT